MGFDFQNCFSGKADLTEKNDFLAHIRPVRNLTTLTQVKVDMFLSGILEVVRTFSCTSQRERERERERQRQRERERQRERAW